MATTAELAPVRHRSWGQWRGSGGRIVSLRLLRWAGKKYGAGPAAAVASHLLTPVLSTGGAECCLPFLRP